MNSWKAKTASHPPHLYNLNTQYSTWHMVVSKCWWVLSPIPPSNCSKSLPLSSNPFSNLWNVHLNCQQMTLPERGHHLWNPLSSTLVTYPLTLHSLHTCPNFPPCLCSQRKMCPSSNPKPTPPLCSRSPLISHCFLSHPSRAFLVVQWLRICLAMQGTWVRALVQGDPTYCGAAKSVHHNY